LKRLPNEKVDKLLCSETNTDNMEAFENILHEFYYDVESQERIIDSMNTRQIIDNRFQLDDNKRIFFEIKASEKTDLAYSKYIILIRGLRNNCIINSSGFNSLYDYKAFKTGKITINKNTYKLFKYLKNTLKVKQSEIEPITTIKNNQKLYFCISRNPIDYLFCATNQNHTSCMSLDSDHGKAFYMALPSLLLDTNRMIGFVTNGKTKEYDVKGETFEHFSTMSRSWLVWGKQEINEISEAIGIVNYYPYLNVDFTSFIANYYHLNVSEGAKNEPDFIGQNVFKGAKFEDGTKAGIYHDGSIGLITHEGHCYHSSKAFERVTGPTGNYNFAWFNGFEDLECFDNIYSGASCTTCGCPVSDDDVYYGDDECYCSDCFYEKFSFCDDCGVECHLDDMSEGSDGYTHYCRDCFDKSFVICQQCDEVIDMDDSRCDENGDCYCESCFDSSFFQCYECSEIHDIDDKKEGADNNNYCEHCYDKKYIECDICSEIIEIDDSQLSSDGKNCCNVCYDEIEDRENDLAMCA